VGTLGVITQATLRAQPYIEGKATTLLYFRNLAQAGEAVLQIKDLDVAAIEIVNHTSLAIVKERRPELELPSGKAHMLLVEYEGPARHEQITRVQELVRANGYDMAGEAITVNDRQERDRLWQVRKALLPTIRAYRRDLKALSVVNDVGVDVIHLADLIRDIEAVFARLGLVAAIYGHAGSGNLHLRPLFPVDSPDLPALVTRVAQEVYEVVLGYEGTITAEHGMGRLRAPYLAREWGPTITGYMRQIKEIFDPTRVLNPEVMFSDRALTDDIKPL
jgi:FAD/FMN-containing dehydrogenase